MNALIPLNNLPATKTAIQNTAQKYVDLVVNGEVEPVKLDYALKVTEETIKSIRKNDQVKELVLDDAGQYRGDTINGASVTLVDRKKYDYSKDSKWQRLNDQIEQLKAEQKRHEKLMQTIEKPVIDEETGEEIQPAYQTSNLYVKWELPK
jgi:hypothetical protein